ncbi:MAG TPA: 1-acyl-sn-glycerol-3-phosphate acyltransferase [Bacteroidales bacterium]|nr:1-acyl-sn-glycerol-3-phosphate acyltransferase [Bacteroidales bacterium]
MEHRENFLNIDQIFRKKGKKIYPLIPKVLIRYLERITHQEELNDALWRFRDFKNLDFVREILFNLFQVNLNVVGIENLPEKSRFIVVGNHPLGGLDGMALMHVVGKLHPNIKSLSNDILLELPNLREMFVPVNKHGSNSNDAVNALNEVFESDQVVMVFPAGLVSRKQKGKIMDLEWKKTFISKATKNQRDVVPVHFTGRNSDFFYNLALWRKRLGIKANIEMLYLVDEMFKQKNKQITITFGKPIPFTTFTREKSPREWAECVKQHVYGLPEGKLIFD